MCFGRRGTHFEGEVLCADDAIAREYRGFVRKGFIMKAAMVRILDIART